MKRIVIVMGLCTIVCCMTAGIQTVRNEYQNALKATPEWINLKADLDKYDEDYISATNKIAAVSDNATRQALSKMLNLTDDHQKVIKDLKKIVNMISDQQ